MPSRSELPSIIALLRDALLSAAVLLGLFSSAPSLAQQNTAAPAAAPNPAATAEPQVVEVPPPPAPRSVSDVIKILDQYKPDPAAADAARATLALPAPPGDDRKALFKFHFQRGLAARKLSDDSGAIIDLRKAREHLPIGDQEALFALGELANAEFQSGNALNTVEVLQQRLSIIPRNQLGSVVSG